MNTTKTNNLVNLLRNTVEAQVLEKLQGAVHEAVSAAIEGVVAVAATKALPVQEAETADGRPVQGGRCRAIWDYLDSQSAAGKETGLVQMKRYAAKRGWNENTSRIQFYRWRAYRKASPANQAAAKPAGATVAMPVVRTATYRGPDRRKAH